MTALASATFREQLAAAVNRRHCADHPLAVKWANGEISRNARMGWAVEHYHWVSNVFPCFFEVCVRAPKDVVLAQLENYMEENDPSRSHLDIVLRFAEANGADIDEVKRGRGLPTTESWVRFLRHAAEQPNWIAGAAAMNIGTESQSPKLYGKLLPSLRNVYKYDEAAIEHFWLHVEADEEHGGKIYDLLDKHCVTRELQDLAIHWAYEGARMRWFYFDGIYMNYEMGYPLAAA